jgi:2-keto-3-deoxy-L-rhamnonate aldolase RhmA
MNANPQSQPAWVNPVKQRLAAGLPVLGATIATSSVEAAAHAAALGFDFLWIEMEHSPIGLDTLRQMVLATRGLKAVPFARPPVNELWTAKRVLDAGVLGVIFPFTSSAELARRAVEGCRYPPLGRRGSGASLAQLRWPVPEGYHDFADRNVLVVAVVEDAPGLENIDAIAATPGLDVVFIGTSDLAFALGLRGAQDHPRLHDAITRIVEAARRHGKALGRPARTPTDIQRYRDQGFLFFQTGTELDLMSDGAQALLGNTYTDPLHGGTSAV